MAQSDSRLLDAAVVNTGEMIPNLVTPQDTGALPHLLRRGTDPGGEAAGAIRGTAGICSAGLWLIAGRGWELCGVLMEQLRERSNHSHSIGAVPLASPGRAPEECYFWQAPSVPKKGADL